MNEEWTNAWFSEAEALAWRSAGFTLKQAFAFREAKITVEQAIALREQQGSLDVHPSMDGAIQKIDGILSKIMHKIEGTIKAYPKLIGCTTSIILVIILVVVIGHYDSNPVNVIGDWSGQATILGTAGPSVTMEINQENSGSISGQFDDGTPFTGNVDGNNIDITWKPVNVPQTTAELTGTVAGNEITGNLKITSPDPSSNLISLSIQLQRDQSSGGQN